jgi:hypothetical protein
MLNSGNREGGRFIVAAQAPQAAREQGSHNRRVLLPDQHAILTTGGW